MRRVFALLLALLMAVPVSGAAASIAPYPAPGASPHPEGNPSVPSPSDVRAYWRLDEGSGTTAADSSANGLPGTVQGATWVSRRSGSALSFASWSDRVVVPRNILLEPTTVTVDAWVRANGTPGQWAQIVGKGETVCTTASYSLYTGSGSGLAFFIGNGSSAILSPTVSTSIWDNTWHHVAGSFDGTKVHLYVDGAEIGTGTATNGMQIGYGMTLTNDLAIGSALTQCPGGNKPWVGQIDNVRVWGRALSLAEIQTLLPTTTTTLTSSPNPSTAGTSATLAATVSPSSATGTVTFTDVTGGASTVLGTAPLAAGVASLATSFATVGKRQLVASYSGNADYDPSTSPALSHVVASPTLTPTTTTLAVTANPVTVGAPTTFIATVSPIPSTGDVEWIIDGVPAGVTPVGADGRASTSRSYPAPGTHTVRAHFVEGTLYAESLSDVVTLTVLPVTYSVTLTADPANVVTGSTTHLTATVSPAAAGTVRFYRQGSQDQLLSSQAAVGGKATLDPVVQSGTTTYRADFLPAGATTVAGSATTIVQGKYRSTVSLAANTTLATAGETLITLSATLGDWDATGTVTFRDVTGSTPAVLGTVTLAANEADDLVATLSVRLAGPGVHAIDAVYDGNTKYWPASSNVVSITVSPDVGVSASGVGVSYSTFYPYKDSYRDAVAVRGTPGEPVSVSVRVYNSSGRVVRSWSLATRSDAWALAWNGRTASGTRLPAGRYRVVQTLRDALGHMKAFTSYTTISTKRLYWYTGSITKAGISYSNYIEGPAGWIRPSSRYYRGLEVSYSAWAGYRFVMKSAVKYGTLKFAVLGSPRPGWGVAYISFWNPTYGDEDGARWVGRSYAWYSTSTPPTNHVFSTNRVHAFVTADSSNRGWYDVAKVRLTYRYALLK